MSVAVILGASAVISYLLGSVNFAVIVTRRLGDVRNAGSGNAGATNVFRVYGPRAAALTALGDVSKGALAALSPWAAALLLSAEMATPWSVLTHGADTTGLGVAGLGGLAGALVTPWWGALWAAIGHVWPVFFGFRGGKAVLVTVGGSTVASPLAALILTVALFAAVMILKKVLPHVSQVSLLAAGLLPVVATAVAILTHQHHVWITVTFTVALAALVLWAHRGNLARLRHGVENDARGNCASAGKQ